jgi:hypothetical protein
MNTQQAHQEFSRNLNVEFEKEPCCQEECPICYDCITNINTTTTECGHKFHSSCIFNNLKYGLDCPLCRTELVKVEKEENEGEEDDDEEEYDDDDEEYDSSDDEESDDEDNDNNINDEQPEIKKYDFTMEQVAKRMMKMNISYADLIGYMLADSNKQMVEQDKKKYSRKTTRNISKILFDIIEYQVAVDYRDERTYAQVVAQN